MVYFPTSQEWLHQSSLLLQACPRTTKVTTKYRIQKPTEAKSRRRKVAEPAAATQDGEETQAQQGPRAFLVLKTYDPKSGVCLKYRTDKAAEVGRLMNSLGTLGRHMAGLPEAEDIAMPDAATQEQGSGAQSPAPEAAAAKDTKSELSAAPGVGGSAAGKRKKKGKK